MNNLRGLDRPPQAWSLIMGTSNSDHQHDGHGSTGPVTPTRPEVGASLAKLSRTHNEARQAGRLDDQNHRTGRLPRPDGNTATLVPRLRPYGMGV